MASFPLVFNEIPSRPVQLTMNGGVGENEMNNPQDVILVQSLLNRFSEYDGGPQVDILVNGHCGFDTISTIRWYQHKNFILMEDGHIRQRGNTMRSLITRLNARDGLPKGLPNLTGPSMQVQDLLNIKSAPTQPSPNFVLTPEQLNQSGHGISFPKTSTSWSRGNWYVGWKIVSSGSLSISLGHAGGIIMNLYMEHDTQPGIQYCFQLAGAGISFSVLPAGWDTSFSESKSFNSQLIRMPTSLWMGPDPYPNAASFVPMAVNLISLGANTPMLTGWSGTLLNLGGIPNLFPNLRAGVTGLQFGLPGPEFNAFLGAIVNWT